MVETGHAADALRDGAGELVVHEVPVHSSGFVVATFKLEWRQWKAIASEDNAKGTYSPVTRLDWPDVSHWVTPR